MKLDRYKNHTVELVIDRLKVSESDTTRLRDTIDNALHQGDKQLVVYDVEADTVAYYSQMLISMHTSDASMARIERITE